MIEKDRGGKRGDEAEGEDRFPPVAVRELREKDHSEERADVLHDEIGGGPPLLAGGERGGGDRRVLRLERVLDRRANERAAEKADSPEADDAGHAENHAQNRRAAPLHLAEEAAVAAHRLATSEPAGVTRRDPFDRLLEAEHNENAEEGRGRTDPEQVFPRVHRIHLRERHGDQAGSDVAHRRECLEETERLGPRQLGQRIRNECHRETEHAADAEAGERAIDHEFSHVP